MKKETPYKQLGAVSRTKMLLNGKHWTHIVSAGNNAVCEVYGKDIKECESNAAFIVKACNNYDAMKEGLENALLQLEYLNGKQERGTSNSEIERLNQLLHNLDK